MLSPISPLRAKKGKVVSADEAVRVIRDFDTVALGGFVGIGFAEEIAMCIEDNFLKHQRPKNLTIIYAAGMGDGKDRGLNHFGHEGLVAKVIGGHWGLVPKLQHLAITNKIQAYNLPQGVISHMYRDIAAKKPRTITTVGLNTFVDPRLEGGKLNSVTQEDIVELMLFDSKEYLAYKNCPINVAILRGTTADTNGNVTMEKEALTLESLSIAIAAKNSGGYVIVQVERIAESESLNPRQVKIPGIFVDCVVVSKPENHMQTFDYQYNPAYSSEIRVPIQSIEPMKLTERKIIARRAAFELEVNSVTNLGIGMPEGIARIANEEKILDLITLTAEPGLIGGLPAGGLSFGAGTNADAVIDQPSQFDFYDGGGLDIAFLGLAQADQNGNLNVSKFGPKIAGAGGFINISQNAKKIVFVGTFTAKGLKVNIQNGMIEILREGETKKFIHAVEQITFSGKYAVEKNQPVLFITERCVFSFGKNGMELIEVAPGIDIEKDILSQMDFKPYCPKEPRLMDERIFKPQAMGIKEKLLCVSLDERLNYNPIKNMFFVNFEGLSVNSREDISKIEKSVIERLSPLNTKVFTIVNYDNFTINPEIVDEYTAMVDRLVKTYYSGVTRYTTSAFLRLKLGEAMKKRNVAPHIYESSEEAENALNLNM
ncbi:MAG: acyl CoA:acetate/3-ketoacid CoA transferase [Proteobacteria bacterium]|nr:acyl CoA:acetate/3-ketoacid CoA transferase [Pseudomonadota bacterium]